MKRYGVGLVVRAAMALLLAGGLEATAAERVDALYQAHCAVCHGARLDGGLGGSLVDGQWRHGGTDADLARVIAEGLPDLDMEGYADRLSAEQIRALVIFIREHETRQRDAAQTLPVPVAGEVTVTRRAAYRMENVVDSGLEIPWAIAFLPDGRRLVTERPGRLRVIDRDGRLRPEAVADLPPVLHHGQGGLMDVAIHPDYATNGWIYLALTDGSRNPLGRNVRAMTAIVRGRLEGMRWTDSEWIWRADASFYGSSGVHFGSRIVFDGAGHVFFVVGERGGWHEAQQLDRPAGKIFRLHDDGREPADNPFRGTPGALPGIWSYGHRNPQGMARDPRDGALYATEHGPRGGDEFNLIKPGKNYGWPEVTHGMHYDGRPIAADTERAGMEAPLLHWTPSIAACGLACYTGQAFPDWRYDFFAGGLAGQVIQRLRVADGAVVEQEVILKNIGRVRDVKVGPDGLLYVVLNGPDRVVRLAPAERAPDGP